MTTRLILAVAAISLAGLGGSTTLLQTNRAGPTATPDQRDSATSLASLEDRFATRVRPFLGRYCFTCHNAEKHKGSLDLSQYSSTQAISASFRHWDRVIERLQAEEMPPDGAPRRPKPSERAAVITWLKELRDHEAKQNAGDPGIVLARRLSNAELDYTIRDLTGVDIRPTRAFPVDPANESGFGNSGESLTMSPTLLKKYLAAARLVADHIVLKPHGFGFAPHPVVTDTDRDKYCVRRIIEFYDRHRVDYRDYFLALWRFQHRDTLGNPKGSLCDFARAAHLSPKYLATVSSVLSEAQSTDDPVKTVQARWKKIVTDAASEDEARRECERLRDLVVNLRKHFAPKVEKLQVKGISQGSQPFVLWRNDRLAALHMRAPVERSDAADGALFCRVFPDAFVVSERAPFYDPSSSPKGRLLSAGFHLMQGFYRDDKPLYELVLDDSERRELDRLWQELDFITRAPVRQYKDFVFFERAEPPRFMYEATFDFARSEDKDVTSEAKMRKLATVYLAKVRQLGASKEATGAIERYFAEIGSAVRRVESARLAAEPGHLEALAQFAERAYRRRLTGAESADLLAFYHRLRNEEKLGHEDALRDTVVSVLMSPQFCYRFDLATPETGARPLSDYELANRLSYFLWASMPDGELLDHAAAGDLHRPEVLKSQARRMLRDPRVRGLAVEFGGQWLDFRRFEEHNSVDRQRFPTFTNDLREAMFEEPIRYFMDIFQRDRSVRDFLYGIDTFVNRPLARHYGIPLGEPGALATGGGSDEWFHIDHADLYERGGLLAMAVFQTKNAPGLRTSPVKRGYWVVRRLLGEQIPPPPPTVPELPKDEANLGELTLPQALARHRKDKACAACHRRFDSVGLAFEGFGPIGERRAKDLGGHPVENSAVYPDGIERNGLAGLRAYLREKRQDDFVDNLCRKLFSYALGRGPLISDRKALDGMRAKLRSDDFRIGSLVEAIVTSPQFLNKRGGEDSRGR